MLKKILAIVFTTLSVALLAFNIIFSINYRYYSSTDPYMVCNAAIDAPAGSNIGVCNSSSTAPIPARWWAISIALLLLSIYVDSRVLMKKRVQKSKKTRKKTKTAS